MSQQSEDLPRDESRVTPLGWMGRRRLRYKQWPTVPFAEVKASFRTGDIILFHKTTRTGFLDGLELDFVSPLLFRDNEFRHSGIVLRDGGELLVVECAEHLHSGYSEATYPTGGKGIRIVSLERLLEAYTRDNGEPHFGVKFISREIPPARVYATLQEYGPVNYLKIHRSVLLYLSRFLLPGPIRRNVLDAFRHEMMCSEFVHSMLNKCGALKDYPSKLFAPYLIENARGFRKLEIVAYSDVVRFTW
ncbi:MAG: hypothetical protein ABIS03_05465 [Gemmatimonadaceae bacterium]